jgi:flagellar motor switch protein FliN/FliY
MSEATVPVPESEALDFIGIWNDSFSQVLGQVTGAAFPCALEKEKPASLPAAIESDLWAMITCSGSVRGEMSLRLAASAVLRLGQAFMSEPPTPDAQPTTDHRDGTVELLRQVGGIVATSAKERWGEIQFLVEAAAAAPSWPAAVECWVRAGDPTASVFLEFGISAALIAQLKMEKTEAVPIQPPEPVAVAGAGTHDAAQAPGTLDLLMDVELAMTLRFGSRTLALREILELGPGAVVELDRRVQDPVDLLLDGKLIGRGEVVVIEGSYGLRLTEISSLGSE